MIKAVFFDINDTVVNHSQAQRISIRKMSALLGGQKKEEFTKIWNEVAKRYWDLFEEKKITFEEQRLRRIKEVWHYFNAELSAKQIELYAKHYTTYYEEALVVNPDLKVVIELLHADNIPIGIISNGHGPLQRSRLKAARIESYFKNELIFISDEVGLAKPNQRIFELAEKAAGVGPSEIVFYGDDFKNDIEPAKKRGWKTIKVTL